MNRFIVIKLLALPVPVLFSGILYACGGGGTWNSIVPSRSVNHSIASDSASSVPVSLSNGQPNEQTNEETREEIHEETVLLDTFTTDELFQQGSGGCGMSLWQAGGDPRADGILFFNGLEGSKPNGSNTSSAATALIKLDGEFVRLQRVMANGEAFYGQAPVQVFRDPSGEIQVEVVVKRGAPGEIESVSISKGMLRIQQQEHEVETIVVGDAGC